MDNYNQTQYQSFIESIRQTGNALASGTAEVEAAAETIARRIRHYRNRAAALAALASAAAIIIAAIMISGIQYRQPSGQLPYTAFGDLATASDAAVSLSPACGNGRAHAPGLYSAYMNSRDIKERISKKMTSENIRQ